MNSTIATKLGTFTVVRHDCVGNVQMSSGLNDPGWEEPMFCADVVDEKGDLIGTVGNSTLLCLPDGHIQAPLATDRQIVAAVVGDEHIYDTEADGQIAKDILLNGESNNE